MVREILDKIYEMYPNAGCELIYHNQFEFLCAVLLSAQTTDKAVNKITPKLFEKYPDAFKMAKANQNDLIEILKPLGLAINKSKYLINLATDLVEKYSGEIPTERKDIESLSGVGRKTCNVYLAQIHQIPNIAVDTHVHRVTQRLGLVKEKSSVLETENQLKLIIDKNEWIKAHHAFLFLGRYTCKSKNPDCINCKLNEICKKNI